MSNFLSGLLRKRAHFQPSSRQHRENPILGDRIIDDPSCERTPAWMAHIDAEVTAVCRGIAPI